MAKFQKVFSFSNLGFWIKSFEVKFFAKDTHISNFVFLSLFYRKLVNGRLLSLFFLGPVNEVLVAYLMQPFGLFSMTPKVPMMTKCSADLILTLESDGVHLEGFENGV